MNTLKPLRATIFLSLGLLLVGCNDTNTKNETNTTTHEKQEITKDQVVKQSVDLPVDIFFKEQYFPGEDVSFTRSIKSVQVEDFKDADEEQSFFDRYSTNFRPMIKDNLHDYKKVTIDMFQKFDKEWHKDFYEAFILDKTSAIFVGEEVTDNPVLNEQFKTITTDYKAGKTGEETGEIILAIPKDLMKNKVQLKTVKRIDDEPETIYVDLN